jgi:hypothetical protein
MSNTTNQNNTTNSVVIPINIYTDYKREENSSDYFKLQIEYTAFQIEAVAYFMRMTATGHALLDQVSDTVLLDLSEFVENVQLGCRLIEAMTHSIELPVVRLASAVEKETVAVEAIPNEKTEAK